MTKKKLVCAGLALVLGGYLILFQLPYLIDPGLRDVHIRDAIKTLNEDECAEIVNGCEEIYREHIESLGDSGYAHTENIPESAARVGYSEATISRERVEFRAGAGAFSQVGPIMIICWMDPNSMQATYLILDDGRIFNPRSQRLGRNSVSDPIIELPAEQDATSDR